MSKIITDEGIIIETQGDTFYFSGIPNSSEYAYAIFSVKYSWVKDAFYPGTWKKVKNGQVSFCVRDRGEGSLILWAAFCPEKAANPDYTLSSVYTFGLSEDNVITFPC